MLTEKQKISHLLGELIPYALEGEPQRVTITIEDQGERIQVTVEDTGAKRGAHECLEAECLFGRAGRNELKDYYSGLAGEESLGPCDLRIVSMMVDGGGIEQSETGTKLTVWWKRE
jgi:hypothetical protein